MRTSLPIDEVVDSIIDIVSEQPLLIVSAPPGSGKTTRVAPGLLMAPGRQQDKRIYLLQPRRLAARSVATRIANENGWELGKEVGYHVRFEKKFSRQTRLVVATEGVLLRRLQEDPTLDDTSVVILDEFHERSLDADVLLGMLRQIQGSVRDDLRIIIMSATLDHATLSRDLGNAPTISVEGRMFPVDVRYRAPRFQQSMIEAVADTILTRLDHHPGDVLAFLPGQGEIHRVRDLLQRENRLRDFDIHALYGSLPLEDQTRIIQPGSRRKIVLATNVAETSLTIEGIQIVVDSGQVRVMRYDPSVGLDRLCLEPITQDSATQRTGRAGRVSEGICYRLWDEKSHRARPEQLEPEVRRIDLANAVLQLFRSGHVDVLSFPWITAPREESVASAIRLLERLGAIKANRLTELGKQLAKLPLHPRLGRMVIDGHRRGHLQSISMVAAMLSERNPFQTREVNRERSPSAGRTPHTAQRRRWPSDVFVRLELLQNFRRDGDGETIFGRLHHGTVAPIVNAARDIVKQVMDTFEVCQDQEVQARKTSDVTGKLAADGKSNWEGAVDGISEEESVMRAILCGFPDRLAKRRAVGKNSALMVGGRAVQIGVESGVHEADLFVCVDVDGRGTEPMVRQASAVDMSWLIGDLIQERDELFFHPTQQQVVARRRLYWDDLILSETPVAILDQAASAKILHQAALGAWSSVFPSDSLELSSLIRRCQWLRSVLPEADLPELSESILHEICRDLCETCRSFSELKKANWRDWVRGRFTNDQMQLLDREAPERIQVPSGSMIRLEYESGKPPILAVKIQEVFSWKETPRLAKGRVPILLHLLAPNMRPQQITDDLSSFWSTGYTMVKKDLKRRYPKHAWPDDPTTATPSKR